MPVRVPSMRRFGDLSLRLPRAKPIEIGAGSSACEPIDVTAGALGSGGPLGG